MIFLCQNMLHLADGPTLHEFMVSHLVVPGGTESCDEDDEAEDSEAGRHGCGDAWIADFIRSLHGSQFQKGNQEDVKFDELLAEEGDENLDECQEQNPAYTAEE